LPLRVGDRGLLRDPGEHRIPAGFEVLDVRPPPLARRGAARARAEGLATPDLPQDYLRRNGFVQAAEFKAMGLPPVGDRVGEWLVDPDRFARLRGDIGRVVAEWSQEHPLAAGMPVETLRQRLDLPSPDLVAALLNGFEVSGGLLRQPGEGLTPAVERAVRALEQRLDEHPFRAPEADELRELGLGKRELAAAVRLSRLSAIADGVVLGPSAEARAAAALAGIAQPFTVSQARRALDSTRRVMIPLLERLDAAGLTEHLGDGTRRLIGHANPMPGG
jgi:selenocysteine-specific elongation factor